MRTPEHRAQPRAGKKFEAELEMHYLSPGAFTVLPLDMDRIPEPPSAPPPYRLPTTRRHRHQSFAIIGEPTSSSQNSRSSSPSGRVSPFKGRGFNPAGSRHASPCTSPTPPQDPKNIPSTSRIPKPRKSSTGAVFGERVSHVSFLNRQASQSLTSLEERQKRPPPSPRKRLKGNTAFKQLSPIQGSSPEPSQSLSSPCRIPTKSNSTPPSRLTSPTRSSRPPVRSQSKPNLGRISRNPSPSPTKVPINRYQHVQSKVNSYHKPKTSDLSEDSSEAATKKRKTSFNRTSSRPNLLPKTFMGNNYTSDSSDATPNKSVSAKSFGPKVTSDNKKPNTPKPDKKLFDELPKTNNKSDETKTNKKASTPKPDKKADELPKTNELPKTDKKAATPKPDKKSSNEPSKTNNKNSSTSNETKPLPEESGSNKGEEVPLAMDVVSSTTTTVTKPLKIETPSLGNRKPISPLIDGRVLSATSVSQAINKMNDTVLNTQTLIKDSGLQTRLNPTITTTNSESKPTATIVNSNNNMNNNSSAKIINNHKLLGSMDSSLASTPVSNNKKSANDRILEARTVIAADVKPIRITVREKPSEDVQSGNVGPHFGVSNGISERIRPSLPPQQQPPPEEVAKEEPPPNRCKRFLDTCTKALRCQKCKTIPKIDKVQEEVTKNGCFKCFERKKADEATATRAEQVRISIEDEEGKEVKKPNVWQKLNCCNKNKIRDSQSCLPLGKRKESWVQRKSTTESFLDSEIQQKTKCCSKQGCGNFFRKMFCRKKPEPLPTVQQRKASMMSNKKKSLTPTSVPPPPEDTKPKIDGSLVEHTSHMKGAIPVLPVWLAWFCCMMNCFGPGTGTILSGLFCLCIGKPRFSQKDGPKPRIGAFIIDLIIGCSQFFTVLFCLVGWGWSIWWGVIMVKVARKHRKFRHMEKLEENAGKPQLAGRQQKDTERGRT
ncbi:unnamed protein product [Ceutorhynchus assimilis]|uniref:Protein stum n=1 Tax=Ceutorhynchus assimilis TaxID=467358 RepID=A0A9P0DGP8_9CUCU|nr:unnamed protein product [Ceutorhynchus assimilis]